MKRTSDPVASSAKMDERNRRVYGDPQVVKHYRGASALQPAERVIFDRIANDLTDAALLDVGVGGGRTTLHLAPRVRRYVGLDYAPAMIAAASERFSTSGYEFVVGDARSLPFPDSEFDVVLFSHNGIDYVDHAGRLVALREIRRVLWPGGLFIFSTHNLEREDLRFEPSPQEGLLRRAFGARKRARLRAENRHCDEVGNQPHAVINDGSFSFRAMTYHIRPRAQIEQLLTAGFEDVRAFSGKTGLEYHAAERAAAGDPWLYYLCRSS